MTSQTVNQEIKLSKMINPHFKGVWNTKRPYRVLRGGRGSFKSSTVSLKLVLKMKRHAKLNQKVNVICLRENTAYLRDSVYSQIGWAIDMLGASDEFNFNVSPMKITHIRTGSTFYFYGGDDPMKLKSNIVGNVIAVWFNNWVTR